MKKQTSEEKLPDLLAPNLDVVFVGTAAGHRSAQEKAYYAHPGNRFWRALHEAGLTDRRYEPHEYPVLLDLKIGFTDMCKIGQGCDHELDPDHFDVKRFEKSIRKFRPRVVAFTSKKAASVWSGRQTGKIQLGRWMLERPDDFPEVFVLPSPSGLATSYWDVTYWLELAKYVRSPMNAVHSCADRSFRQA